MAEEEANISEEKLNNPKYGVFKKFEEAEMDSDIEEEENDTDDELQVLTYKEMDQMGKGKIVYEKKKNHKQKGVLIDPRKNQRYRRTLISANLHLSSSWYYVRILRSRRINLRKYGANPHFEPMDKHSLSYELRTTEDAVIQFLQNEYTSDAVGKFLSFVKQLNTEPLSFSNLEDFLAKFEKADPTFADDFQILDNRINYDGAGMIMKRGLQYPNLLRYLPQLLPDQFKDIMLTHPEHVHVVQDLSNALEKEPHIFGFRKILFRDFDVIGAEASLDSLKKSGLFAICDSIYQNALEIYHTLKKHCYTEGHTCILLSNLPNRLDIRILTEEFDEALLFLTGNKIFKIFEMHGKKYVALYTLWKYEEKICKGIMELYDKHEKLPTILRYTVENNPAFASMFSDDDQMLALKLIKFHPVVVISGKGGCGKTTVVTKALQAAYPQENTVECPKILYTAPTGKAAKLLGKRGNSPGFTLHQVIYSFKHYLKNMKENPGATWKFCSVHTLVVDESSLVPVSIFSTMLETLLKNSDVRRIIFLGDVRQLPSIEPGLVLDDIFKAACLPGSCVELRTNHRSESELIVQNATLISYGRYPEFDDQRNFKLFKVDEDKDTDFTNKEFHKILRYEEGLRDHRTSHIVAFRRKDIEWINDLACMHYNHHTIKDTNKKKLCFRIGDKVCMYKNALATLYKKEGNTIVPVPAKEEDSLKEDPYMKAMMTEDGQSLLGDLEEMEDKSCEHGEKSNAAEGGTNTPEEPKHEQVRLCNGEIFFIVDDHEILETHGTHRTKRYLELSDGDIQNEIKIWIDFHEVMMKCKMKHAWAKTIHTFQGSECETVMYVVGSAGYQNWQHVYTAVTRGKKTVLILSRESDLRRAIRNKEKKRVTSLKYQLQQKIPSREDIRQIHENMPTSDEVSTQVGTQSEKALQDLSITDMEQTREPSVGTSSDSLRFKCNNYPSTHVVQHDAKQTPPPSCFHDSINGMNNGKGAIKKSPNKEDAFHSNGLSEKKQCSTITMSTSKGTQDNLMTKNICTPSVKRNLLDVLATSTPMNKCDNKPNKDAKLEAAVDNTLDLFEESTKHLWTNDIENILGGSSDGSEINFPKEDPFSSDEMDQYISEISSQSFVINENSGSSRHSQDTNSKSNSPKQLGDSECSIIVGACPPTKHNNSNYIEEFSSDESSSNMNQRQKRILDNEYYNSHSADPMITPTKQRKKGEAHTGVSPMFKSLQFK